jgi:hypothetical protein
VLFLTVHRYQQTREEFWRNGRLIALASTADDDGTPHEIKSVAGPDGIKVTSARTAGRCRPRACRQASGTPAQGPDCRHKQTPALHRGRSQKCHDRTNGRTPHRVRRSIQSLSRHGALAKDERRPRKIRSNNLVRHRAILGEDKLAKRLKPTPSRRIADQVQDAQQWIDKNERLIRFSSTAKAKVASAPLRTRYPGCKI